MNLSDKQLDRYARHIILKEIGGAGQLKLLGAHILIIGAGGLGCPALQYLAAAGIGEITLMDDDDVSLSNLQRQLIYTSDDIGKPKVNAAQQYVAAFNPDIKINAINQRFTAQHFSNDTLQKIDVILDGCDNFETRLIASQIAHQNRIPLVSAAVGPFEGQLATYRGWQADKPCYQCLVGEQPDRPDTNCADQGVLGALTGILGAMAAMEAIRSIVPFGEDQAGKLTLFDALSLRFRSIAVPKDPGCRLCGSDAWPD